MLNDNLQYLTRGIVDCHSTFLPKMRLANNIASTNNPQIPNIKSYKNIFRKTQYSNLTLANGS